MSRAALKKLEDNTIVAVCFDGHAWPRPLLSSTAIPRGWLALLEKRDGTRRMVPAGEDPRPGDEDRLVLVRSQAISVPLTMEDEPAACGNLVSGSCELLVRWQARDDDLAALRRSLLSAPQLTRDRLAEALGSAGGTNAIRSFIRNHPAQRLVREDLRNPLLQAFHEQLKRFLFETGLILQRIHKLDLTSTTLDRQQALRRQAAQRVERIKTTQMLEAASFAATKRRLNDLQDLLEKLKGAAAANQTQWHTLLPALSPAERGRLLENLWRITPDRHVAAAIAVIAGDECLWLDPLDPERVVRRVKVGGELGGLRSIVYCAPKNWLLVGSASGVWALDADSGDVSRRFAVPDVKPPRTGFNAAVVVGQRLYATSSQLGCWSWSLEGADAQPILRPEAGMPNRVRAAATTDDGRVLFAADDCVQAYWPETGQLSALGSATDVICSLATLENKLFVGTAIGKVYRVDLDHPDDWRLVQQLTVPVESMQIRRWADLIELVIPAGARGVSGIYDEQNVVTNLLSSTTPIRRAWACDDLVVGLSQLRDRLVVMNANLPERTGRQACIARMTSQSIQDACIVTKTHQNDDENPHIQRTNA